MSVFCRTVDQTKWREEDYITKGAHLFRLVHLQQLCKSGLHPLWADVHAKWGNGCQLNIEVFMLKVVQQHIHSCLWTCVTKGVEQVDHIISVLSVTESGSQQRHNSLLDLFGLRERKMFTYSALNAYNSKCNTYKACLGVDICMYICN